MILFQLYDGTARFLQQIHWAPQYWPPAQATSGKLDYASCHSSRIIRRRLKIPSLAWRLPQPEGKDHLEISRKYDLYGEIRDTSCKYIGN